MKPLEPTILLLCGLLVFLTLALFASEAFFRSDGQFFQVVSSMATGVMGALLGLITGRAVGKTPPGGQGGSDGQSHE